MSVFDESKHPRDDFGRFTEKGNGRKSKRKQALDILRKRLKPKNEEPTRESAGIKSSNTECTEEQYNAFGWGVANDIITSEHLDYFYSEFPKIKTKYAKNKTKFGEYMIPVCEQSGVFEGVHNTIIYATGNHIDNVGITRILQIDEYDERKLCKARKAVIYNERRGIRATTYGIFRLYNRAYYEYNEYIKRNTKQGN
jgi:hypothetical protein